MNHSNGEQSTGLDHVSIRWPTGIGSKKKLHETVEAIDRVHAEKENKLHEHRRMIDQFLAKLQEVAAKFTRDIGKHDYADEASQVQHQKDIFQLVVKREGQVLATLILTGSVPVLFFRDSTGFLAGRIGRMSGTASRV